MKTRFFCVIISTLLLVSSFFISTQSIAQSETHDFITYDTLINAPTAQGIYGTTWRLRISRPVGMFGNGPDSENRPLIMFSPGQGEMGTDYSKLQFAGPHYWLNNGWDGGITLPNGKHYPILITAISSNKYFNGKEYAELLNIILSIYHIRRNSVNVGGLSQGGFASSSSIYYERVPGDEFGMKQITSLLSLQGIDEWPCGYPSTANKYVGAAWEQWARKYGGKFLGLEGTSDPRSISVVSEQVNAGSSGNGYLGYENISGGGHCCWNDMMNPSRTSWRSVAPYGVNMTYGVKPTTMGTYKDGDYLMKWMLLQGDISMVGAGAPANVAPVVNAGYAQTITLPTNSLSISGSASDADGSISSIFWSMVSGPNTATINSSASYTTAVSGLIAGTYIFRLTATDNKGASASSDVTITVNTASAGAPAPPPPGGGFAIPGKIEAESYSAMNNVKNDGNSMDAGGTSLVGWINAGSWMDYNVNVASAGAYTVNLRIAAPAAGSQLQIRNAAGTVLSTVNIPNTTSYLTWQTISTTITLPVGSQTIRVYALTAGWNINWMEFISTGGAAPGSKSIPGKIESESYDAMNSIQTDVCDDVNGGRYVGWISAGSWMDYNVNVSDAGTYTFNLRIAAPAAGSQLQLRNAAGSVLATVTIPNTSSYLAWQTITSAVRLPAGSQTIRIYAVTAGWNINWMEFVSQASSPGVTGPSAGYVALPATIESEDYVAMNNVKTDASMDVSGGKLVGWIYPGSWMDYNVYSQDASQYTVNLRVASPNWSSQLQIRNAAGDILSTVNIPNTNSYLAWQTITTSVYLPAGDQTIRVYAATAGWNINWIEFVNGSSGLITQSARVITTTPTIGTGNSTTVEKASVIGAQVLNIYPNPVNDNFTLELSNPHLGTLSIQVVDVSGAVKKVYTYRKEQIFTRINLSAAGLAPGSYFIRANIGDWKEVKKMIKL